MIKKYMTHIFILITLILLSGCSKLNKTEIFSSDMDSYAKCNENVVSMGTCVTKVYGYEFDSISNECVEVIEYACYTISPFKSIIECQNSCFTQSEYKDIE